MILMVKILIVEDEKSILKLLHTILTANQYEVIEASTGAEALSMITSHCPDLILLDLGLPDMDGNSLLAAVRKWTATPIIVVSARTHELDKVEAIDLGADDYITKPFGTSELLARIRMALRHAQTMNATGQISKTGQFKHGGLVIDYLKYRVYVDQVDAQLTQGEYRIVALLGKYAGRVLTYDFIMKELWGPCPKADNKILRVNMANIRRKIEKTPTNPKYIFTEVGVGYRMAEEDADALESNTSEVSNQPC
ncbi:MAG: response regulator transcription factor [Clostridia bacterium]